MERKHTPYVHSDKSDNYHHHLPSVPPLMTVVFVDHQLIQECGRYLPEKNDFDRPRVSHQEVVPMALLLSLEH